MEFEKEEEMAKRLFEVSYEAGHGIKRKEATISSGKAEALRSVKGRRKKAGLSEGTGYKAKVKRHS